MPGIEFLIVFLLIVLNGLLAMSELAVVSAKESRLQQKADEGNEGARVALQLAAEPDRFLSTVQIGITLIGVGTGALGGATLSAPVGELLARIPGIGATSGKSIAGIVVVLVITYLSLVIGELVPKRIALQKAEAMATLMSRPLRTLSTITKPIVTVLAWSSDIVLRLIGQHGGEEPTVTEDEVHHLLREGREAGVFERAEAEMVAGVFDIGDRTAGELMTPRHRVIFLDLEESDDHNRALMQEASHSHYPVCEGSTDNVVGVVSTRALWQQALRGEPIDLRAAMTQPFFVPEIAPVLTVVEQMRRAGTRDAIVVDEYGGVAGLLTLNDVLSDVVGELDDDTNTGIKGSVRRDDGSWLLDGNFPAHETRELLDIAELPGEEDGHFETIGGFVMDQLGHIPRAGQSVRIEDYVIEVVDMDGHRIDKLLVQQVPMEPSENDTFSERV
ncbi:MAG TPA: hemolysin family protein [Thermomicrobiales bacterium]|nr:hemolysin family protein [Thermomicrobiales bacterium]